MGLIPEETIAQILDRVDIVEVISGYIPLKSAGKNFKAVCPFHNEKTPSFVVNPDKQIFHCFGCGVGGDVFAFIMKQDRLTFPEAVRFLAEKVQVAIPETGRSDGQQSAPLRQKIFSLNEVAADYFCRTLLFDKSTETEAARRYLKARGVHKKAVEEFRLGFAKKGWRDLMDHLKTKKIPLRLMEQAGLIVSKESGAGYYDRFRGRIMFPIWNTQGRCLAFGGRVLPEEGETAGAKYVNSPETRVYRKGRYLYALNLSKEEITRQDAVIIVEGYMDCLVPFQAGVKNIVASLGTALTEEQVRLVRRYTRNAYLLFDKDDAGEKAMLRSMDLLIKEGLTVRVIDLDEGDDPDSFIRRDGPEAFRERIRRAKDFFDYKLQWLGERHDLGSPEGKSAVSRQMLRSIRLLPDAILRTEYTRRLAQALRVDQQAVLMELNRTERGQKTIKVMPHRPSSEGVSVERMILGIVCEDPALLSHVCEVVRIEDFQDSVVKEVLEVMTRWRQAGERAGLDRLMTYFAGKTVVQSVLTSLTAGSGDRAGRSKILDDCLNRVRQRRLKSRIRAIQQEIREVEEADDKERLMALTREYQVLSKEFHLK